MTLVGSSERMWPGLAGFRERMKLKAMKQSCKLCERQYGTTLHNQLTLK